MIHRVAGTIIGSSPQVRGTFPQLQRRLGYLGLIPAGAGNIRSLRSATVSAWAHPRRCGEHSSSDHATTNKSRLIPAGAGNINLRPKTRTATRAHPRRCGEHVGPEGSSRVHVGSSPQVRGTFDGVGAEQQVAGLIPAGAGNMKLVIKTGSPFKAHPRRCGEHGAVRLMCGPSLGSSPQVRGT